jgi:hypothetical protein
MPADKETTMRAQKALAAAVMLAAAAVLAAGQDPPERAPAKAPEKVFLRLSVYPTASLSRYDYNNDLDLYEVRIYVELRRGSQEGASIADAFVTALGEKLDYDQDHYERRVPVDKDKPPAEIEVEIALKGKAAFRERFPLPDWLVLREPRPAVLETGRDLGLLWRFDRFPAPVDVHAYDFKTGREIFKRENMAETSAVIPAADLPASTIVRIYAIQSWLYKRFLGGDGYARGSEINIIPWTQVFVRTR